MGNVCDDGGWLHLAAPQAEYDNQDYVWSDENDCVAGEASDANNLCNMVMRCVSFCRRETHISFAFVPTYVLPHM